MPVLSFFFLNSIGTKRGSPHLPHTACLCASSAITFALPPGLKKLLCGGRPHLGCSWKAHCTVASKGGHVEGGAPSPNISPNLSPQKGNQSTGPWDPQSVDTDWFSSWGLWNSCYPTGPRQRLYGRKWWGQRLSLALPTSYFHQNNSAFISLACCGFSFKFCFEEKFQTTILRFDLRPASTGSILAFHVGMAPAFQYKVSSCGAWVTDQGPSLCLHTQVHTQTHFVCVCVC